MFDEQLSRSPSEDPFESGQKAAGPAFATASSLSPRNHAFRPCQLGLLGLAIAVFLWGFGYKLSLYHKTQSNGSVVKMWVEHRNTTEVLDSSFNSGFSRIPILQALSIAIHLQLADQSSIICTEHIARRNIQYFDYLIPFRSPPAQS